MLFDEEYFKSDDFQELLHEYEEAIASGDIMFLDADDFVDIADYYNMNGDNEQAVSTAERGLAIYPDDVLLNVFMARQSLDRKDYEEASRIASRIGDKEAPDYYYLQAEILIAQNKIEEADKYLLDYGKTVAPDEYGDFVKDVANLYVDYDVSQKAYEWMLRTVGDNSDDFKELMARTLFGLGKYKDSQHIFNELIDRNPFSKQYWTALASAQFMDEDYNASVTSSEYVIAIDPNDPDGLLAKANGLLKLGNYEQAAEYFSRFSAVCPDEAIGPMHQAVCLVNLNRNQEAIPLLEQALTLTQDDDILVQTYQELAFAHSACGNLQQAMKMLDMAENLNCDYTDLLVVRGHILLSNKKLDEGEACFRQAIKLSDGNPDIIIRIIVSLYDNCYIRAAYIMLKRLYDLIDGDRFPNGYPYLVLCCWELHYDKECLKYLKKAIALAPSETRIALEHLFPDDMPVEEYYEYMKENIKDKD